MLNRYVFAVVAALIAIPSWGQAPLVLDEEKVVELALKRNELNAISQNQLKEAEYRLDKARSYLYPILTATGTVSKFYIVPEKRLPGGLQINSGEITLSQPLYTFGRLSSGIEIAELDKEITDNSVKATVADIKKTARQIYYNAVFSKNLLKIARESLSNANKNRSALGERVSFGRINQNDNLKMQADVASREPLLHEARKLHDAALEDLAYFLNFPREQIKDVTDSMDALVSRTPVTEKPVESFVDIRSAEKGVRLTAAQKELAKMDYMPTLSAFASYQPTHSTTDISVPGVLMTDTATFGLRLDFDLPLGGTKGDEVKIRTVAENSAILNLQRVKREVSKQQTSLIQQLKTLQERSHSISNAIKLAERSYRVALASFRNGNVSQLQLNDSELLLTQNKINYVQNLLQIKVLESELERLQTEGRR